MIDDMRMPIAVLLESSNSSQVAVPFSRIHVWLTTKLQVVQSLSDSACGCSSTDTRKMQHVGDAHVPHAIHTDPQTYFDS
jgi:hypothetical protein